MYNLYYIDQGGKNKSLMGLTLEQTLAYTSWILRRGMEITGIISVEDDV